MDDHDLDVGKMQQEPGLSLRLNYEDDGTRSDQYPRPKAELKLERSSSTATTSSLEPSLTLALIPNDDGGTGSSKACLASTGVVGRGGRQSSSLNSMMTSFSSGGGHHRPSKIKRDSDEADKDSSRISDEEEEDGTARKKLRLTKEQSALLEDKFKDHATLNPKQKQTLARQLNLRPRQVEVWFQNRRARTKLKKTEVECEFLRKCCETLTEENRRLKKELQEFKSLKLTTPRRYVQLPTAAGAAAFTMCPSCKKVTAGGNSGGESGSLVVAPKPRFFNPFAHSAAY